jgi:hypothetical protein
MPFVVATTVGGLSAGVTYYVSSILSNTTFVAATTNPKRSTTSVSYIN